MVASSPLVARTPTVSCVSMTPTFAMNATNNTSYTKKDTAIVLPAPTPIACIAITLTSAMSVTKTTTCKVTEPACVETDLHPLKSPVTLLSAPNARSSENALSANSDTILLKTKTEIAAVSPAPLPTATLAPSNWSL